MSDGPTSPLHTTRIGHPDFALPTPGEVLGLVVDILDLGARPEANLLRRRETPTTKRYFAGTPISPDKEDEIIRAIAAGLAALLESARNQSSAGQPADLAAGLAAILKQLAGEWG